MSKKLRISSQWAHDPAQYAFGRSSGLPADYFHASPKWPRVLLALSVIAAIAFGLWITSATLSDEEIAATFHHAARSR